MTNDKTEPEPANGARGPQEILGDVDRVQSNFTKGLENDPRLASGIPPSQRGTDIEFIQMSGLVRGPVETKPLVPPSPGDLDASKPVSFFEKGVADVDAEMAPGSVEDHEVAHLEIQPAASMNGAMRHLRTIIDDLTRDAPAIQTDPELMASLDAATEPLRPAISSDAAPGTVTATPVHEDETRTSVDADHVRPAPETPVEVDDAAPAYAVSQAAEPSPPDAVHRDTDTGPTTRPGDDTPGESARPPEPIRISTLAEAGQLLGALDSDEDFPPQSLFEDTGPSRLDEAPPEIAPREAAGVEDLAGLARAAATEAPRRRRRRPRPNKAVRLMLRMAAGLLVAVGLAWGGVAGYRYANVAMASPARLFYEAERAAAKGDYRRASELYTQFAQHNPGDPRRAEAQFAAAFALQLVKPGSRDAQLEITRKALELFDTFRKENPAHPKTARAETIMGRLLYDSGKYHEAIELLRNPELRLKDPVAAVPALRTLARAYAQLGDEQAARSYYLQSVGAQDNHSPDVDYAELGSLYHTLAERETDPDRRIGLEKLAIEYWEHALQTPGIDPSSKQILRSQVSVLREHLLSEPGMAPAMEALEEADLLDPMPISELSEHGVADETVEEGPSETPGPPAAVETEPVSRNVYIVQKGDALSVIAANHGVTLDAVMQENGLTDPNLLIGQRLIIPATAR